MTPENMLEAAQNLRDAGVLIFERRCWSDEVCLSDYDGAMYRRVHGCGSYFRWVHGLPSACPFCGQIWDYSKKFPYTNPELFPLSLNYTAKAHEMTEEEYNLRKASTECVPLEGILEKQLRS